MKWPRRHICCVVLAAAGLLNPTASAASEGARAAYASAAALQEQGLYDLAADAWRDLLADAPDGPLALRARYNLGVCRFHSGAFDEAAELFTTVADAERYPELAEAAYANLGLSHLNAARTRIANPRHAAERVESGLRAAVAAFDQGIERYAQGAMAVSNHFHRGEALSLLKQHAEAAGAYRLAIAGAPEKSLERRARIGLANALLETREYGAIAEAVALLIGDEAAPLLSAEALLLRGEAGLAMSKPAAAANDFAAAARVDRFADAAYAAERAAFGWYTAGDPLKAATAYDWLVERFPESPQTPSARLSAGKCWLLAKQPAKAAERLEAVWRATPTAANADAARWWARALLALNTPAAARSAAEEALATRPSDPAPLREIVDAALLAEATSRFAKEDTATAFELLQGVATPTPEIVRLRALCLIKLKRVEAAEAAVLEAERRKLDKNLLAELRHELGWMHRDAGNGEQALASFTRVAELSRGGALAAESLYRVGEIHNESKRHDEAAEAFAAAAEIAGGGDAELHEQALHLLGWAQWNRGDRAAAAKAFREQLKVAPEGALSADGRLMLGECLFAEESYAEALAAFRAGLESKQPPNRELTPLALLHAGQAAGQAGDWKTSLALLERARRRVKETPLADEAAYERAWALHKLGRDAEAAPEFARLADSARGVLAARAAFVRGELHFAAKEHEQAVRLFFRVAYGFGGRDAPPEFHPWQAESLFEAARCLEQLDRVDPALKLYAELIERFPESPKAAPARDRLESANGSAG